MSYDARKTALDTMQPAAWAVDDWMRQHCSSIGLLRLPIHTVCVDTGLEPESVVEALFELSAGSVIAWDQEDLTVYMCGWATDRASPNSFIQIVWRAEATKWPDTGPRAQLERELEELKQGGRRRLQLVSSGGESVSGPERIAGVRS